MCTKKRLRQPRYQALELSEERKRRRTERRAELGRQKRERVGGRGVWRREGAEQRARAEAAERERER